MGINFAGGISGEMSVRGKCSGVFRGEISEWGNFSLGKIMCGR